MSTHTDAPTGAEPAAADQELRPGSSEAEGATTPGRRVADLLGVDVRWWSIARGRAIARPTHVHTQEVGHSPARGGRPLSLRRP
ncbi:MAG: hypothetical protein AAFN30_16230, partial [Actinomycetota bacterium]